MKKVSILLMLLMAFTLISMPFNYSVETQDGPQKVMLANTGCDENYLDEKDKDAKGVPEPTIMYLLFGSLAGYGVYRKFNKKK